MPTISDIISSRLRTDIFPAGLAALATLLRTAAVRAALGNQKRLNLPCHSHAFFSGTAPARLSG